MSQRLFPSAIDLVRHINANIVDNLLVGKPSYVNLPSLYKRAYWLVYETGDVPYTDNTVAPDATVNANPKTTRIIIDPRTVK